MKKTDQNYHHFTNDVRPIREKHWMSLFNQISVPVCLEDVNSVMEFGPGRGLSSAIFKHYGLKYKSADVGNYGLKPDYNCSIMEFPAGKTFDLVCAFQVLEHNPPETFVPHLKKMASASNKYVYVSLPFYGRWLSLNLSINFPKISQNFIKTLTFNRLPAKRPIEKYRKSKTPYSHHWFEVGDKGFKKKDLHHHAASAGMKIVSMKHSHAFPYHVFVLMEKV